MFLPKAGAQCAKRARWDLCGGRPVRAVPTANRWDTTGSLTHPFTHPAPSSPSELVGYGGEREGLYIALGRYVKVTVFGDPEEGGGEGEVG